MMLLLNKLQNIIDSENLKKKFYFLLTVNLLVMIIVFSVSGIFNTSIDTAMYVAQIDGFSHGSSALAHDQATSFRFFKPFYGIVGASLNLITQNSFVSILIVNIVFYIALTFLAYLFLRYLCFSTRYATMGSLWVATAYPLLKYGLALGTDISGWFFTMAVIVLGLYAFSKESMRSVVALSVLGFIGSLTKETGVLGLIFVGIYILMQIGAWNFKKVMKWLACLCVPFFALEGLFLYFLHVIGAPTFLDWYKSNQTGYTKHYYKLHYFVGVEGSTFHIVLVLTFIGLIFAIIKKDIIKREWLQRYLPLLIACAPVILWPVFISRILFAQFIVVIPLALYGLLKLDEKYLNKKWHTLLVISLFVVPIIISFVLFFISGTGSLFSVVQQAF